MCTCCVGCLEDPNPSQEVIWLTRQYVKNKMKYIYI